jgi:hypothetical protein
MTNKTSTTWKPGQSGNLRGKPPGTRNKATMAVLALMEGGAEEVTRAVVDAAKGGDLAAARLVLERLAPPMRERPISIDLPDTTTAKGIEKASQAVLDAAASGDLLLGEAQVLTGIIESRRKALETQEFEKRLAALEARNVAA